MQDASVLLDNIFVLDFKNQINTTTYFITELKYFELIRVGRTFDSSFRVLTGIYTVVNIFSFGLGQEYVIYECMCKLEVHCNDNCITIVLKWP